MLEDKRKAMMDQFEQEKLAMAKASLRLALDGAGNL